METSTTTVSYNDWRSAVDERIQRTYCITIEDAGFDEGYLINHWRSSETAFEFVEWFGNKNDLDPVASFTLPHERSR